MQLVAAIIIFCILLFAADAGAQNTSSPPIDTVKIYKFKSGVRYRTYKRHWFHGIGISSSFAWRADKMNKQDSLVMKESNTLRYFKAYGRNERPIMEGQRAANGFELQGDVKFYYRTGKLKRIEHWNNTYRKDTCGYSLSLNDAPGAERTWKYFRRNGSLRKQLDYSIQMFSCKPLSYCYRKTITRYNRGERVRSIQHKHWYCYRRDANKNRNSVE